MKRTATACVAGTAALLLVAACGGIAVEPRDDAGTDVDDRTEGPADVPPGEEGTTEDVPDDVPGDVPPDESVEEDAGDDDAGYDVPPGCGNGHLEGDEQCDDGNTRPGDGCEPDCTWTCEGAAECADTEPCNGEEACEEHVCVAGTPLVDGTTCNDSEGALGSCQDGVCVAAQCRNNVVEPGEECDDGNNTAGDGCEPDCTWTCEIDADCDDEAYCNGEEPCDEHRCRPGTPLGEVSCDPDGGGEGTCRAGLCVPNLCGNTFRDPGEDCDDGNTSNTDSCLNDCTSASCGDGFIWAGVETCEGTGEPCTTTCSSAGWRACTVCNLSATCTPPRELCNGADDDCNGVCDNGFGCCRGATSRAPDTTYPSCTVTRTCDGGCVWSTPSYGAVPANDACAGAISLSPDGGSAIATGSTCAAADNYTLACPAGSTGGPDVVYQLTLTARRFVVVSTEGSNYDTVLQVGSGACPGTSLACNDDRDALTRWSQVALTLDPGTYWILIDGFYTSRGDYVLNLYTSAPAPNDTCGAATPLTLSMTPATVWGSLVDATDDDEICTTGRPTAGPDVWYSFTLPTPHLMYFDLLDYGTWSGVLRIYERGPAGGGCPGALITCAGGPSCGLSQPQWLGVLGSADGTSRTYYVAVDAESAAVSDSFALRHQMAAPACSTATILAGSGTTYGNLLGIASRTRGSCGGDGDDAMYVLAKCPGATVLADTCDPATSFDSVLYARRNGCGIPVAGSAEELACNTRPDPMCTGRPFATDISFGGAAYGAGMYFLFVDSDAGSIIEQTFGLNVTVF